MHLATNPVLFISHNFMQQTVGQANCLKQVYWN